MNEEMKKKIVFTLSEYQKQSSVLLSQLDILKTFIIEACELLYGEDRYTSTELMTLKTHLNVMDTDVLHDDFKMILTQIKSSYSSYSSDESVIRNKLRQVLSLLIPFAVDGGVSSSIDNFYQSFDEQKDMVILLEQYGFVIEQLSSFFQILLKKYHEQADGNKSTTDVFSAQISEQLLLLLKHLAIPEELTEKLTQLTSALKLPMTHQSLIGMLGELTALVMASYQIEQKRFKGFLDELTNKLSDFETHLHFSAKENKSRRESTETFELTLQQNISIMKNDINEATNVKVLSGQLTNTLTKMLSTISVYKEDEVQRSIEYELRIQALQTRLSASEHETEEMKRLVNYHKMRLNLDGLSQLPNRQGYDDEMAEALSRFRRFRTPLTIAIADIDHFKSINDQFGHLAGDKVLKKIAAIFRQHIRMDDFVARYGGEEFVFIFEKSTVEEVYHAVEKLRLQVVNCPFAYKDEHVDVTVSFGIAEAVKGDDKESLFMRADKKLYEAKHQGRNRVAF